MADDRSHNNGPDADEQDSGGPQDPILTLLGEAQRLATENDFEGARKVLDHALRVCQQAGDLLAAGGVFEQLGDLERSFGHFHDAHDTYERAATLYRRGGYPAGEANAILSRGDARRALGRDDEAREDYITAGKLFERIDDTLGCAHARFKLAESYVYVNPETAQQHFMRAASLYEQADAEAGPASSLRLANPPLPDTIGDCRMLEGWLMAHVAVREADRLRPSAEEEAAEKPPRRVRLQRFARDAAVGTAAFAIVATVFRIILFVATTPNTDLLHLSAVLYAAIAILVACAAAGLVRMFGVQHRTIQLAAALGVFVFAFRSSSTLLQQQRLTALGETILAELDTRPANPHELAGELMKYAGALNVLTQPDKARAAYDKAVELYQKLQDPKGEISALLAHAGLERSLNEADDARQLYGQVVRLCRQSNDRTTQASALLSIANVDRAAQQIARARQSASEALTLLQQVGDRIGQARAWITVGDLDRTLQRPAQSRESYKKAATLYQQLNDADAQAQVWLRLGRLEGDTGDSGAARQAFAKAMTIYQQSKSPSGQGRVWRHIGDLESAQDHDAAARDAYSRALATYHAAHDDNGRATVYQRLGKLERAADRQEQALVLYTQALEIFRQTGNATGEARVLISLGSLHQYLGHIDEARDAYTAATAIYDWHPAPTRQTRALLKLGDLETLLGHVEPARQAFSRALRLYEGLGDLNGQATALNRLARALMDSDPKLARQYLARAAALATSAMRESTPEADATEPHAGHRHAAPVTDEHGADTAPAA